MRDSARQGRGLAWRPDCRAGTGLNRCQGRADEQLAKSLALNAVLEASRMADPGDSAQVLLLVDAATLRTRSAAITQLARAGIFRVPEGLQRFVR